MVNTSYGSVVEHVARSILNTYKDTKFRNELTSFKQNVLKWTMLFHKIEKRGSPTIRGEDHVHPFNSARTMLNIFE